MSDTPIRPSRDFLVTQAVLNAALVYEPDTARLLGVPRTVRCYCTKEWDYCRSDFVKVVQACFRDLAGTYRVAA